MITTVLLDDAFSKRLGDGFGLGMDLQFFVDALPNAWKKLLTNGQLHPIP